MNEEAPLVIGGRQLRRPTADNAQLSILLWGKAGCGKTTLASTAPGTKLFMLFDAHGTDSLTGREDCLEMNLVDEGHTVIGEFAKADPFSLSKWFERYPNIETLVMDSITTMADKALENAVAVSKNSTILLPGQNGWTARNSLIKRSVSMMIRFCQRHNKHVIFTAHEGNPRVNDQGAVIEMPSILSSNLVEPLIIPLGEVWWLNDLGSSKDRRIAIRPTRLRTLMKSRMWDTEGEPEFVWRYSVKTMKGDGISTWFDMWRANGGRKLALPK